MTGGLVGRLTENLGTWLPPRDLAAQPNAVIQGTGYDTGRSLRSYHINVGYAPLLDFDISALPQVSTRFCGQLVRMLLARLIW